MVSFRTAVFCAGLMVLSTTVPAIAFHTASSSLLKGFYNDIHPVAQSQTESSPSRQLT